jgi:polar amino acid transport system substrate-binding protein
MKRTTVDPILISLKLFLLAVALLLASGCELADVPKDIVGTMDHVVHGVVYVGVAVNPPWTLLEPEPDGRGDSVPRGVEVALVEAFADQLDADIVWVFGAPSDLLAALEERELDLVIGGFVSGSPALAEVSVTQTYYTEEIIVAVANSASAFDDIAGREIAVPIGSKTAALVSSEGGAPVRIAELSAEDVPLAAPAWLAEAWGLYPTPIELEEREHVMAVPPGENAWIVEVDLFLKAHGDEVHEELVVNDAE